MNLCILIGHLGDEPETKIFESGNVCTRLRLATTERGYVTRAGSQVPDRTSWHNVVLWGGIARVAADNLHKGDQICVKGRYETRDYEDKSGAPRTAYEVNAEEFYFLSPKKQKDDGQQQQPAADNQPAGTEPKMPF